MAFLYTLLGIILFFIVLFLIPVRVCGHYDGTFTMYIKYAFLKFSIFPMKEKKEKPKKEKKKTEKPEEEKEKKKKTKEKKDNIFLNFYKNQGFEATLQLIADALNAAGGMFGGIFKHFVFRELYLSMSIVGSDAADTAIKYGKISSAVFPAMGFICSKAKVKKYDIDITPDFVGKEDKAEFHFQFGLCPIFITNSLIVAGFKLVKNVLFKLLKVQSADNKEKTNLEKQVKKAIKER